MINSQRKSSAYCCLDTTVNARLNFRVEFLDKLEFVLEVTQ